jgi:eukaryotic-like serine/threonine-protein kinase
METPSADESLDAAPARQAGRYRLGPVLGAGAMGVVHRSHDPALDRTLAIKLIATQTEPRRDPTDPEGTKSRLFVTGESPPPSMTGIDEARLLEEARALARVAHPAIVEVFDVGVCEAGVFIAMELVEGEPLRSWIAKRAPPWRTVVALHLQAGEALAAAHREGIVHGDFKPDNVLVAASATLPDGLPRVKVVDFGLARAIGRDEPRSGEPSASVTLFGTPAYLAPECWGAAQREPSADQFAFFVSLCESIVGRRPYGRCTSLAVLLQRMSSGPDLAALPRNVPPRLRRAIERGLDPEPTRRFASMDDALAELRATIEGRSRLVIAAAALAVAGGAAVVLWPARDPPPPDPAALAKCDADAAAIGEVYGDEERAKIQGALAQYGDTAARVRERLDGYASEWSSLRASTCRRELGHEPGASALVSQRAQCFDERSSALAGLVELLAASDDAIARHAVRWAADLPRIDACDDTAALSRHPAWPEDAAARARIADAHRVLVRAELIGAANRPEEALELAEGPGAEAEALGDRALQASVQWTRGRALALLGRYDDAKAELERGYFAARETDDETAAALATELASLLGSKLARIDDAMVWIRHAETALASLGGEPGEAQARLDIVRAGIEIRRGRLEDALAPAQRARDLRAARFGEDHPSVASAELTIGSALAQLDRLEEAQAHFERARDILVKTLGPDHLDVAAVEHNLAMASAKLEHYEDARAHAQRSLAIRERWLPPDHPDLATSLVGLANAELGLGLLDDADRDFARVLALRERAFGREHPAVAETLGNVAKVASARGDCSAAATALQRALAITRDDPPAQLRFGRALADAQQACKRNDEAGAQERR